MEGYLLSLKLDAKLHKFTLLYYKAKSIIIKKLKIIPIKIIFGMIFLFYFNFCLMYPEQKSDNLMTILHAQ